MFKSRTVDEEGYYELEFNSQGFHLTKISHEEVKSLPIQYWVYMSPGQYVEGDDINTWRKRPFIWDLIEAKSFKEDKPEQTVQQHVCKFEEYHGLFEVNKVCTICGKNE